MGAYAGPASVLTALIARAQFSICKPISSAWGSTDISCFQHPPHFPVCYHHWTTQMDASSLFAHFQLLPRDDSKSIPPASCNWLKTLVQSHLQSLPLLELLTLISLFLPQIPRESLRTRDLHSLHPPDEALTLVRLHDGLEGMEQH